MKNFLKGIYLFCSPFLLLNCGEATPPVKPTANQVERLLGGDSVKTWKKISSMDKNTGDSIACFDKANGTIWRFLVRKDSISFVDNTVCTAEKSLVAVRYTVQTKNQKNYINLYKGFLTEADSLVLDTTKVNREIIFITDKEFTSEFVNSSNITMVEKFVVVD